MLALGSYFPLVIRIFLSRVYAFIPMALATTMMMTKGCMAVNTISQSIPLVPANAKKVGMVNTTMSKKYKS